MTDLSKTIVPKSDQLNADDLIVGTKTVTITSVTVGEGEQCVSIGFSGDDGKPWKPCKSMRRLLIFAWGADGDNYIGRKVTLHNDPSVKWAGAEVGGIRITHMSDINGTLRMMMTVSRGKRIPYVVEQIITVPENVLSDEEFNVLSVRMDEAKTMKELSGVANGIKRGNYNKSGRDRLNEIYKAASARIRGI